MIWKWSISWWTRRSASRWTDRVRYSERSFFVIRSIFYTYECKVYTVLKWIVKMRPVSSLHYENWLWNGINGKHVNLYTTTNCRDVVHYKTFRNVDKRMSKRLKKTTQKQKHSNILLLVNKTGSYFSLLCLWQPLPFK